MSGLPTVPLVVRDLHRSFGTTEAVAGVDLELAEGEILALVGPSGCGKSTLLRVIAGLLEADRGEVELGGQLVEDGVRRLPPESRSAGLVFQEHALFPHITVAENVSFGLRSLSAGDTSRRVEEMLGLVDLSGYGERFPHELSGGERQRVALARALAPSPRVMLFDEPFASLDHNLRTQLRHQVSKVLRETGTAAVFVTHDQREALAIGDRIAVLRDGRIAQIGTAEEIFHRPIGTFVASFMGDASFLQISHNGEQARSALGPIEVSGDIAGTCSMVRPDDVLFEASPDGDAAVVGADYVGTHWLVTTKLQNGETVLHHASHLEIPTPGSRGVVAMAPGHRQVQVLLT